MASTIKITGRVKLDGHSKDGELLWSTGWLENTITETGLAAITGLAGDVDSQSAFTYLAIGTDSSAESASSTALGAEITDSGLERASAIVTRETTTVANDTLQLYKQWTATGIKAVEEIGAFNAASSGIMLGRKLTTTKTTVVGETLTATYQFIFS